MDIDALNSTTEWHRTRIKEAIAVRNKDREFHGLEREFLYLQADMLSAYERSKDVKHPRDIGNARETILRNFLALSGYLPARFKVTDQSVRVVSTTGHSSREVDIALIERDEAIRLMNREGVYEVYPVESVYGVVQVKSRLNKKEIADAIKNIESVKALSSQSGAEVRPFGLIFAFDTDLEWGKLVEELQNAAAGVLSAHLPNSVTVLAKGEIRFGEEARAGIENSDLAVIKTLALHGRPDSTGLCLYSFYANILNLLRNAKVCHVNPHSYFRLPLISGSASYTFAFGEFAEYAACPSHGPYQRRITPENLNKLISWCRASESIDAGKALAIAHDELATFDPSKTRALGGETFIYNPDSIPFPQLLSSGAHQALTVDSIETDGKRIWVPYYYTDKVGIISGCPLCEKMRAKMG
jgi:hypothetical protein